MDFTSFIIENRRKYNFLENKLKNESIRCKEILFSDNFKTLYYEFKGESSKIKINNFILHLIAIVDGLKFFSEKEVFDKLKKYGVSINVTIYMIHINKLKSLLDEITLKGGVYINPYLALLKIDFYLRIKLIDEIQKENNFCNYIGSSETEISAIANKFDSIKKSNFRYIKEGKPIPLNSDSNLIFRGEYEWAAYYPEGYNFLQKAFRGNVLDISLKQILLEPLRMYPDKYNPDTDYFFKFYKLLVLLMPEEILTEKALLEKADRDTRTIRQYFYNDIITDKFKIKF